MTNETRRSALRAFLKERRARLKPQAVGLPGGGHRRVPGLRREEVASLAGVSVTWYTMFESGAADNVSPATIRAIARALRFTDAETEYVVALATAPLAPAVSQTVDAPTLRMIRSFVLAPAYVLTPTWEMLAWNDALAIVWGSPASFGTTNVLKQVLTPAVRAIHGDRWECNIGAVIAMARVGYARRRGDATYEALICELLEDRDFRRMWELGDVAEPLASTHSEIVSPRVGRFVYDVINLPLPASPDQTLVVQIPDDESEALLARAFRTCGA